MSTKTSHNVKNLKIKIDEPQVAYFPGQKLVGKVSFSIKKDNVICQQINVFLQGVASSHWNNGRSSDASAGKETLIDEYVTVWKNDKSSGEIPKGDYSLPFQLDLAPKQALKSESGHVQLPSSYEDEQGRIVYSLFTTVADIHKLKYLNVVSVLDVNHHNYESPVTASRKKSLLLSGQIELSVQLTRGAFCPGEQAEVIVSVDNKSSSTLKEYIFSLIKVADFRAGESHALLKKSIYSTQVKEDIVKHSEHRKELNFKVPVCVPTITPDVCKLIHVEYFAVVVLRTRPLSFNMKLEVPVTIGSIPKAPKNNRLGLDDLRKMSMKRLPQNVVINAKVDVEKSTKSLADLSVNDNNANITRKLQKKPTYLYIDPEGTAERTVGFSLHADEESVESDVESE